MPKKYGQTFRQKYGCVSHWILYCILLHIVYLSSSMLLRLVGYMLNKLWEGQFLLENDLMSYASTRERERERERARLAGRVWSKQSVVSTNVFPKSVQCSYFTHLDYKFHGAWPNMNGLLRSHRPIQTHVVYVTDLRKTFFPSAFTDWRRHIEGHNSFSITRKTTNLPKCCI